jgi:hypothetical protein
MSYEDLHHDESNGFVLVILMFIFFVYILGQISHRLTLKKI